jgi:transcriptional regulator with XRE-family HTH domain
VARPDLLAPDRGLALAVLVCVADELGIAPRDARRLTPATFDDAPVGVRGAWTALRVAAAFDGSWAAAASALAVDWDEPDPGEEPMVPVSDDAILALNVRVRRQAAGLDVEELARLADVAPVALADLECGRRPHVPFVEVARIARAFGLTLDALLEPVQPSEGPAPLCSQHRPQGRSINDGRPLARRQRASGAAAQQSGTDPASR